MQLNKEVMEAIKEDYSSGARLLNLAENYSDYNTGRVLSVEGIADILGSYDNLRPGDQAYFDIDCGTPIGQVAAQLNLTVLEVEQLLVREGHRPVGDYKISLSMSERLRDAYRAIGTTGLMEGVRKIAVQPGLLSVENIGVGERRINVFPALSDDEAELIHSIARDLADRGVVCTPSKSLVARQALEIMIKERQLKQFYKPAGWSSRPLGVPQGAQPAIQRIPGAKTICFALPEYLSIQLEGLKTQRGTTAHSPSAVSFSRVVRKAVDEMDERLVSAYKPLIHPSYLGGSQSATVVFSGDQVSKIERMRQTSGLKQSEVIVACLAHNLGGFQTQLEKMEDWDAQAKSGGNRVRQGEKVQREGIRRRSPVSASQILQRCLNADCNVSQAAAFFGKNYRTAWQTLKQYGITPTHINVLRETKKRALTNPTKLVEYVDKMLSLNTGE